MEQLYNMHELQQDIEGEYMYYMCSNYIVIVVACSKCTLVSVNAPWLINEKTLKIDFLKLVFFSQKKVMLSNTNPLLYFMDIYDRFALDQGDHFIPTLHNRFTDLSMAWYGPLNLHALIVLIEGILQEKGQGIPNMYNVQP